MIEQIIAQNLNININHGFNKNVNDIFINMIN